MRALLTRLHPRAVSTAVLLSLSVAAATANDWPQFRGPAANDLSTETGLLQQWPAGGPPLAWKSTELGEGYSGVAVVGNRLYTAGDSGEESFVLALDAANGKVLWKSKLGKAGPVGMPKFDGPRSTPSISGPLLFAVGQRGELVCLETATGKEVWRKDYLKDFGGKCPAWGFSESPLIDGDKVIITPGGAEGSVVALNQKDGTIVWRSQGFSDPPHYASLTIADIGGVRQYIQLTPESVVGVAAADGRVLWRAPRKGKVAVIPSPIYADGCVFVSSGYGVGCNLFKVTAADGKFSAELVYENKVLADHHGGVILNGGFLYGHSDNGGWTCLDFKTGQAKWQEKNKLGKGSIAYADGRFYLRQEDKQGTVVLLEPSPAGFKEHGRFDQPDRSDKKSWPHPVIANGKLYLRDQGLLLCYNVKAQ